MRRTAGVLLIVAALGTGACGGGGDGSSGARVSSGGISGAVPSGWHSQANGERGIVLAADESDLLHEVPSSARVTAEPADAELPSANALLDVDGGGEPSDVDELRIGGHSAASVTVRGADRVEQDITVALGEGRAALITIEAPPDRFDAARNAIDAILRSLQFDVGAIAASTAGPSEEPIGPTDTIDLPPTETTETAPSGESGDAGPSNFFDANLAQAATDYAVATYGIRVSEPVLATYHSKRDPIWAYVAFDAAGRNIAVWVLRQPCPASAGGGQCWFAMTGTEGGREAQGGLGIPADLQTPYFG